MAGDLHYAAHVDADCRQDPAHPLAMDESLLARHALSHRARADDLADSARPRQFRNSLRFRLARVAHSQERWGHSRDSIAAAQRGGVLSDDDVDVGGGGFSRAKSYKRGRK